MMEKIPSRVALIKGASRGLGLEALAGLKHLKVRYEGALQRYLWHEFGDLALILQYEPGKRML